ncbi:uncharacterized protein LOC126681986 [Mercurialis annua]|uniref:uncharacterized protein LOC126681986 n=1 Tax=Mercurialis annua TaxID=3986 RepID=UPI0021603495|nr:uncharacterized protein LOC126681986 [Mercurialis annua]
MRLRPRELRRRHSATREWFFKIILPSTIENKNLKLPLKFARKCGDELLDVVKLLLPNGRVWNVKIFKYKGMSNFNVRIFNMTTCEIEYPDHELSNDQQPPRNDEVENEDDDCFEISDSIHLASTSKRVLEKRDSTLQKQNLQENPKKGISNKISEEIIELDNENGLKQGELSRNRILNKEKMKNKFDGIAVLRGSEEIETEIFVSARLYRTLSTMSSEIRMAVDAATMCKPKNPTFLVIVLLHYLQDDKLIVPAGFARRYMKNVCEAVKVKDSEDREWTVRSNWQWRGGSLGLNGGWGKFFKDKNLRVGDESSNQKIYLNIATSLTPSVTLGETDKKCVNSYGNVRISHDDMIESCGHREFA